MLPGIILSASHREREATASGWQRVRAVQGWQDQILVGQKDGQALLSQSQAVLSLVSTLSAGQRLLPSSVSEMQPFENVLQVVLISSSSQL